MKAKTIKAYLRKRIDKWLASLPEDVRDQVKDKIIVTGGAIPSMLLNEKVNDIDIYLRDGKAALILAQHYVNKYKELHPTVEGKARIGRLEVVNDHLKTYKPTLVPITSAHEKMADFNEGDRIKIMVKSAGVAGEKSEDETYRYFESQPDDAAGQYIEGIIQGDASGVVEELDDLKGEIKPNQEDHAPEYKPIFLSSNAITLSGKIQIILRFYGEPHVIHENYDFVHCTCYWTSWNYVHEAIQSQLYLSSSTEKGTLVLPAAALHALMAKELIYIGSKYPICSVIRLRKFIKRGFTINAGQIVKMAMQISDLDLKDVKVLEDQLTGVDVAYFAQLINAVNRAEPEKVNTAYVCEIIDRMF
jgi:hypothetical protein